MGFKDRPVLLAALGDLVLYDEIASFDDKGAGRATAAILSREKNLERPISRRLAVQVNPRFGVFVVPAPQNDGDGIRLVFFLSPFSIFPLRGLCTKRAQLPLIVLRKAQDERNFQPTFVVSLSNHRPYRDFWCKAPEGGRGFLCLRLWRPPGVQVRLEDHGGRDGIDPGPVPGGAGTRLPDQPLRLHRGSTVRRRT